MKANAVTFHITPTRALDQGAGVRAARVDPLLDVSEPLEASVLVVWPSEDSAPVVMVTLDSLYPGADLRRAVELGAEGLDSSRVFVAASHTHRAPMTESGRPTLGTPDAEHMRWLVGQLTDHVKRALDPEDAQSVHLELARGVAEHSVHRRRHLALQVGRPFRRNVMAMAPHRSGSVDESLLVAKLVNESGSPIAVLWNYACHPVAHPEPTAYSSHYVHHARAELRRRFGKPALPVLFFQGFSGDTRPNASIGWRGVRGLIQRLVSGPQFRDRMTPANYRRWTASLTARLIETISRVERIKTADLWANRISRPGNEFAEGLTDPVTFHAIRFSHEFAVMGVSAELVSEYAGFARSVADAKYTMCVGCIDNVFGYIPTEKMLSEGGYEAGGFCSAFSIKSLVPGIEQRTKQSLRNVWRDAPR